MEKFSYICKSFVNSIIVINGKTLLKAYEYIYISIYNKFSPFCKESGWTN